ncbi:F-box domain cyclin-like protein [Macrophomina phaseolina MS6]|uniref:F-box domain cyclin-like protein n=1 Tax=Macrophomina phaseolina (strain MS6) TaxID=1126212 RepID=K2R469_MACPH|nr:F-box domain cyclin-like protein [Macrophomina phaseolina MS6]
MRLDRVGRDIPSFRQLQYERKRRLERDQIVANKRQQAGLRKDPIQWSRTPKPQQTQWASIHDLPDELLCKVLNQFSLLDLEECSLDFDQEHSMDKSYLGTTRECNETVEVLLDLCLVSKRIAQFAQPLLHEYPRELNIQSVRRQFIRTVATRRDLAARVRYLVYEEDPYLFRPYKVPATVEMLQIYRYIAPQIKISNKKAFLKALYSGTDDAEMAFLFSITPAISTLRFCVKARWDLHMPWTLRLLTHSTKNWYRHQERGPFCQLQTFRADKCSAAFDLDPTFVSQFIRLPCIQEIDCRHPQADDVGPMKEWPGSATLQTLRLLHSDVPKGLISSIFNACVNIRHLLFSWDLPDLTAWDTQQILKGVRLKPNRLETLELTVHRQAGVWEDHLCRSAPWKSIGSLKDFSHLKKLRIPGFFLTGIPRLRSRVERSSPFSRKSIDFTDGVRIFPDTLEELQIDCEGLPIDPSREKTNACDVTYIIPFLEKLVSICSSGALPNLRILRLRAKYSAARQFFDPIEASVTQANIKLEFIGFAEDATVVPREKEERAPDYGASVEDIWVQNATTPTSPPSHPKSNILDLPSELLMEIMSYLDPTGYLGDYHQSEEDGCITLAAPWRLATLARCCRVSKRFCDIARPIMYQTVTHNGNSERRLRFINTIIANPHLAALVKEVALTTAYPPWQWKLRKEPPPQFGPMEEDYGEIMAKARSMTMGRKEEWLEALAARRQIKDGDKRTDADIPVLLTQVPNLETLSFAVYDGDITNDYFWTLLFLAPIISPQGAYASPSPWKKLRHLVLRFSDEREPACRDIAPFLYRFITTPSLVSLKELRIDGLWSRRPVHFLDRLMPEKRISSVEHLHLGIYQTGPTILRQLIEAPKVLKSFSYEFLTTDKSIRDTKASGIVDMLRFHKNTLESFSITPREDYIEEERHIEHSAMDYRSLGSLKEFTHLKYVRTTGRFLLPFGEGSDIVFEDHHPAERVDLFPPSLEKLVIDGRETVLGSFYTWLEAFMQVHRNDKLPNLRSICFTNVREEVVRKLDAAFLEAGAYFAGAGVRFRVNEFWDAGTFFRDLRTVAAGDLEDDSAVSSADEGFADEPYDWEDLDEALEEVSSEDGDADSHGDAILDHADN